MTVRRGPVVVVGDALLDIDQCGRVRRVSPDAPVPVLEDVEEYLRPGGAALAAELLARDGHEVVLVTPLADDADAARLIGCLHPSVRVIRVPFTGATAVKRRLRAAGQSLLRVDSGRLGEVGAPPAAAVSALQRASGVLVADYGRGATAECGMRALLTGRSDSPPLVWDPHPRGTAPVPGARLVTPNADEAAQFAPGSDAVSNDLAAAGGRAAALVTQWRAGGVVVTRGAQGALLSFGAGAPFVVPAPVTSGRDTCGAGDRFASAATAALARGGLATEAVQEAVASASAFVAAGGAAGLSGSAASGVQDTPSATIDKPNWVVAAVRARGGTVVATGGCFDLLHAGHVENLRAARSLGDCLVVCLNSDSSVRRLKGPGRPVVPQDDRAHVLLALEHVDAVMVFDEDTPEVVLRHLRPQLWVKGGDYAGDRLVEAAVLREWDGTAVVLPYLEGRSTTGMVEQAVAGKASVERP